MEAVQVRCPGCHAKLRVKTSKEEIRCPQPQCQTTFLVAENLVASAATPPASKPKSRTGSNRNGGGGARPRPTKAVPPQDPWDEIDEFDDDEELELPVRRPAKSSSRNKSKGKRGKPARRPRKEIDVTGIRKFGITLMAFGVGAFILPLIGLQIKGLHRLSPEMQSFGGLMFLAVGGMFLAGSFFVEFGFGHLIRKSIKWGVGGFAFLIFFSIAFSVTRGWFRARQHQKDFEKQAQMMNHVPMMPHEMMHHQAADSRTPFGPPNSFRNPLDRIDAEFAKVGSGRTVTIYAEGFGDVSALTEQLKSLASINVSATDQLNGRTRIRLAPVDDFDGFVSGISFATVKDTDRGQRQITLAKK